MKEKKERVLVCPLNWGLGHATRCIPVIQHLQNLNKEVMIAGNGMSIQFLKTDFPELTCFELEGSEINYSASGFSMLSMMMQLPGLIIDVYREHRQIKKIVKEHNIDLIISDNRYGCSSKRAKSVFITHQLFIKMPGNWRWLSGFVNGINHYFIRRFNTCWVPDEKTSPDLSGELSHAEHPAFPAEYIGILSRLQYINSGSDNREYDILVMLSGPEPQRTLLEEKLIDEIGKTEFTTLMVRGKPEENTEPSSIGKIDFKNHLADDKLKFHCLKSKYIVCRSGYSTLMDLAVVGRSAIIIPTPGQSEQEYLAEYHHLNGSHYRVFQHEIDLGKAISKVMDCHPLKIENQRLEYFLQRVFEEYAAVSPN